MSTDPSARARDLADVPVCPSCGFELRIGELHDEYGGTCALCFERVCEEEMAADEWLREQVGEPKLQCVVVGDMIQCRIAP